MAPGWGQPEGHPVLLLYRSLLFRHFRPPTIRVTGQTLVPSQRPGAPVALAREVGLEQPTSFRRSLPACPRAGPTEREAPSAQRRRERAPTAKKATSASAAGDAALPGRRRAATAQ